MRGTGFTISRLPAARAFLAGAAILASAAVRPAFAERTLGTAQTDETAMAVPRVQAPAGPNGVGLPQPLAPSEAARIRRIFALQRAGNLPEAVAQTSRLTDQTLLGHILADRYLARPGRVAAPELADWLGRYADLPDACAIYDRLLATLPPGAPRPAAPASATLAPQAAPAAEAASRPGPARAALVHGRNAEAEQLGRDAWRRSGGRDAAAAYVAGLAAWRRGYAVTAAEWFETAALAPAASPDLAAAAAFWAARSHLRAGQADAWRPWVLRASAAPDTPYGRLARRALGLRPLAAGPSPALGEADLDALAATPRGRRAFALLQVGEPARAEAELRGLWPLVQDDVSMARALFGVARSAGLSSLAQQLGPILVADEALPLASLPSLHPRGGFLLDPALIYAVTRVESNFDPRAKSGAGAHGLMQLTAPALSALQGDARERGALRDPATNLALGQRYLAYLGGVDIAGDDLLRVLASYNAGPGAVQRWAGIDTDDPLMFIETIPTDETRRFVQHTLAAMWEYAARFDLPSPSLDAMAAGAWPKFAPETATRGMALARLH